MIPAGLLCAKCRQPFRGCWARRTRAGYVHTDAHLCKSPMILDSHEGRWEPRGLVKAWVAA